jgi:hypothetical protein
MRIASPAIATIAPIASVLGVGRANQKTRAPRMNPAATRRRAIAAAME